MEIILILFLITILFAVLYLLYKLIVWISKKKARIIGILSIVGAWILVEMINFAFFTKMEFIQSKAYPDLYLIKNPISNQDRVNKIIKEMVIDKMNKEFIGKEYKFKYKYEYTGSSRTDLHYSLSFYTYFNGWGTHPFGEAGTAHFIENKEDPGGFSSEELSHYRKYEIAEFDIQYCENDTVNYYGTIKYYQNETKIKTDTIINKCIKIKQQEISNQ